MPPSPRVLNEKLIWQSKLYEKNQVTRGENAAVGRLGQYAVGDPDGGLRLDKKLKSVTTRAAPGHIKRFSQFDLNTLLKQQVGHSRKPSTLEPLPLDLTNRDVAYQRKGSTTGRRQSSYYAGAQEPRRNSVANRTMAAILPNAGSAVGLGHQRIPSSTQSIAGSIGGQRRRMLQIKGHKTSENAGKPRFNEDVDAEIKSIRAD